MCSFVDNVAASRYEVMVEGLVVGICEYVVTDEAVVLPHTMIYPSMRARGLAVRLVRHALDDLASRGLRVVPTCWFVAEFIEANPEFQPLVAP
jgi:uncharacterized protein